mmetsp:Transcript_46909/g.153587  ORF Transcript_46909/g.153587 Transcript_46909/m.153587 type:complete len:208 (+) Transcript_46909:146-769(+)
MWIVWWASVRRQTADAPRITAPSSGTTAPPTGGCAGRCAARCRRRGRTRCAPRRGRRAADCSTTARHSACTCPRTPLCRRRARRGSRAPPRAEPPWSRSFGSAGRARRRRRRRERRRGGAETERRRRAGASAGARWPLPGAGVRGLHGQPGVPAQLHARERAGHLRRDGDACPLALLPPRQFQFCHHCTRARAAGRLPRALCRREVR